MREIRGGRCLRHMCQNLTNDVALEPDLEKYYGGQNSQLTRFVMVISMLTTRGQ